MGGKKSVEKGKRGEREIVSTLQAVADMTLGKDVVNMHRNLNQADSGGCDVGGVSWMALEVKKAKHLQPQMWWSQAKEQAAKAGTIPVLVYRKDYGHYWYVRMNADVRVKNQRITAPMDMKFPVFVKWFELMLKEYGAGPGPEAE